MRFLGRRRLSAAWVRVLNRLLEIGHSGAESVDDDHLLPVSTTRTCYLAAYSSSRLFGGAASRFVA